MQIASVAEGGVTVSAARAAGAELVHVSPIGACGGCSGIAGGGAGFELQRRGVLGGGVGFVWSGSEGRLSCKRFWSGELER
jgi:hypothetical protein